MRLQISKLFGTKNVDIQLDYKLGIIILYFATKVNNYHKLYNIFLIDFGK